MDCVICNLPIKENEDGWAGGNNALPLADGRCCDECNTLVIIQRWMNLYEDDDRVLIPRKNMVIGLGCVVGTNKTINKEQVE